MGASSDKVPPSVAEQLAAIESRLGEHTGDEKMLQEIHAAMKTLLAGDNKLEQDIRSLLSKRLESGELRNESFQLVQTMLDQIVTEDVETFPDADVARGDFVATDVIPEDSVDINGDTMRLQVGSVLRDRFLLQEKVSGGSMGDVYKALDRRLAEADGIDPWVAVKVLTPKLARNVNALRALQQEAAKGRCLSHPNIVRFIDLDREDDNYFIVMEWLEGRSLSAILDESSSNSMEIDAALDVIRQIGGALDYAHRCGVVHADVKPGNIIITPTGQAKLFDFGIARIRQKRHDGEADFDPGVLNAKTPAYSSMQVLTGEDPAPSDDVYSLGCLMYRLVAGYRVFGPRNAAEAAEEGMEPQRPQGLGQVQWSALRKALAYSRVSRFSSPSEFLQALDQDSGVATMPDDRFEKGVEEHRSSAWRIVALILIVGALAAVVLQAEIVALWQRFAILNGETPAMTTQEPAGALETPALASGEPGASGPAAEIAIEEVAIDEVEAYVPVDFSAMPPASLEVRLAATGLRRTESTLVLREDDPPAIIDLIRNDDSASPLTVRLEEVYYSGNRSPWESGQYRIADDGIVNFAPGQLRARTGISMQADPLREPDRQVSLLVRDNESAESEFALINLTLEDDDQRNFEEGLAPNTVAFAVSQVSVRERDPAVQIDVLRFKPDGGSLEAGYAVRDVTATEGEDYFAPGSTTVSFGPGQRTARILIPLVQDSDPESDEAFMLELDSDSSTAEANIFLRIAVMIRDDDS